MCRVKHASLIKKKRREQCVGIVANFAICYAPQKLFYQPAAPLFLQTIINPSVFQPEVPGSGKLY